MTWRRFRNFLNRLPAESHYQTELRLSLPVETVDEVAKDRHPQEAQWSHTDLLLADLDDRLQRLTNVVIALAGGDVPEFVPKARPGVPVADKSGRRRESVDEKQARREAMKARIDATRKPTAEALAAFASTE